MDKCGRCGEPFDEGSGTWTVDLRIVCQRCWESLCADWFWAAMNDEEITE